VVRGAKNFMIHPVLRKQARQVTGDLAEEDYAGLNQYNSSAWAHLQFDFLLRAIDFRPM